VDFHYVAAAEYQHYQELPMQVDQLVDQLVDD